AWLGFSRTSPAGAFPSPSALAGFPSPHPPDSARPRRLARVGSLPRHSRKEPEILHPHGPPRPIGAGGCPHGAGFHGGRLIMYASHFGLRQRPFPATLDPECYYPATGHEQALARLHQALADDQGFALLTGGTGMGKTLLCHRLLEKLGPDVTTALVTNGPVGDRTGLLQAVLYDLGLPYEGRREQELRLALTECLLLNYGKGRGAVLLLDE